MTFSRFLTPAALLSLSLPLLAGMPEPPPTPAAANGLILARSVTLETGFPYCCSAERPLVTEGTILVLEAEPELILQRAAADPILYVGETPAWRISPYNGSSRFIVFVPGKIDLSAALIWFGHPGLPEQVDSAHGRQERAAALLVGITPFSARQVEAAQARGGSAHYAGRLELLRAMEELVQRYVVPYGSDR